MFNLGEACHHGFSRYFILIESITFAWIRATSASAVATGSAQAVFSLS
ncbi:hypothetical protein M7775_23150 [Sporomusa sphaeroides DSM 2875]|nr:hypothetical protein [Sporomusa sphaeroides]MCM0761453.1 hypothetical protein [Sporomusa sphaeroides DSM 2875]